MIECPTHKRNGTYSYNEFIRPDDITYTVWETEPYATTNKQTMVQALHYVNTNVRYEHDWQKYNRPDLWQFPYETLQKKTGDCEDTSFLLASILINMGIDEVRVALGTLYGEGHAWVEARDGAHWYLLESTSGKMYYLDSRESLGYRVDCHVYSYGCKYPTTTTAPNFSDFIVPAGLLLIGAAVAAGLIAAFLGGGKR